MHRRAIPEPVLDRDAHRFSLTKPQRRSRHLAVIGPDIDLGTILPQQ
jgi:hypothetical protein